jgi:predicted nucleic acid-binding protein
MTVSDWVRRALDLARQRERVSEAGRKIMAVREGARHAYPAGGIDQMLSEIERGYLPAAGGSSSTPTCRCTSSAPHPHKIDAQRLLEEAITRGERLVTDAEVLQEILHRYVAIDRREAIQPAFDALLGIADEAFPVSLEIVQRAKTIVYGKPRLSARDAIHVAAMELNGVPKIISFDRGFDIVPGIERLR